MKKVLGLLALMLALGCSEATAPETTPVDLDPLFQKTCVDGGCAGGGGGGGKSSVPGCSNALASAECFAKFIALGMITVGAGGACTTIVACIGAFGGVGGAWWDYRTTPECRSCPGPTTWDGRPLTTSPIGGGQWNLRLAR